MPSTMKLDDATIERLIDRSRDVMKHAYCPYSKFQVGAALLCEDGTIFEGCNIENAAFFVICAERCALAAAIAKGYRKYVAIAVSSNIPEQFITPCGPCRQFMSEFRYDLQVIITRADKSYEIVCLSELLPRSFGQKDLACGQNKS